MRAALRPEWSARSEDGCETASLVVTHKVSTWHTNLEFGRELWTGDAVVSARVVLPILAFWPPLVLMFT